MMYHQILKLSLLIVEFKVLVLLILTRWHHFRGSKGGIFPLIFFKVLLGRLLGIFDSLYFRIIKLYLEGTI